LLIGGYAVGYHGFPRATGELDIWVAIDPRNAKELVTVLTEFGFGTSGVSEDFFLEPNQIIRMGNPPLRLELLTTISGVEFAEAFSQRVVDDIDGVPVNVISLPFLKLNKRACGRHKDLNDLENLP
jgi:hypothetical protein